MAGTMDWLDSSSSSSGLSSLIGGTNFGDLGGAVSDLFGAFGDSAEGSAYKKAAALERQNEQLAEASTRIQETQAQRQLQMAQGETSSEVAGAGFTQGGSALDIMRSNAEQGALNKSLIQEQGQIQVNNFEQQAESFDTMAKTAEGASIGAGIGGLFKTVGAFAGFL